MLLPLGAIAIRHTRRSQRPELLPLAMMPLLFATQQAIEGLVWLALRAGASPAVLQPLALAYLFFAFALWPAWIPWVAVNLAPLSPYRWRLLLLRVLALAGLLLGLALWLPLLFEPARLITTVQGHSIAYSARLLLSGQAGAIGRLVYMLVIVLPLLLIPLSRVRLFGLALLAAGVLADWFAHHAFTSVWCFLSALLSLWIVWLVRRECSLRPAFAQLASGLS